MCVGGVWGGGGPPQFVLTPLTRWFCADSSKRGEEKTRAEGETLWKNLLISGLVGTAAALYLKKKKKVMISGQGCVPGESNNEAVQWGGSWHQSRKREREREVDCWDNWQRHLDFTAEVTEWHSLPPIAFPSCQLCHISLLFFFSFCSDVFLSLFAVSCFFSA